MEQPNTAATTARSSSIVFNPGYFLTPNGMMKIAEFIFGLICWATLVSYAYYYFFGGYQFVLFVSITAWITTFLYAMIFLLSINENYMEGAPWLLIEVAFNIFWACLYFIAAIVESAVGSNSSSLVTCSIVFCWFTWILYTIHTILAFRSWKNIWFWQICMKSTGGEVNT